MSIFGETLTRLMAERGMTGQQLARLADCSESHVSRLGNGQKHPSQSLAARLDQILSAGDELVRAAANRPVELPLRQMTQQAAEFSRWAETGHAGPSTIAILADEVNRIIRDYAAGPPAPLIERGADAASQVRQLLQQHQRMRHARDLYVNGARCYAFLACAFADLGEQTAAAAHARTAMVLAEESGQSAAMAVALSAMSKCAFWEGARRSAATYARAGYEAARDDPVRVLLACQEADAAPVPQAAEAISRARAALDATGDNDCPPGMFTCRPTRVACYTMTLRLREGDLSGVIDAYEMAAQAVTDGEEPNFGTYMQLKLSAAIAYLRGMEPEAAAEALAPVLALPADRKLATFTGKLTLAATIVAAPPYRASLPARQLAEQLRGYFGPRANLMPYPLAIGPARD
jgi:transcriptional regulator with XRE-family HTH domain